jgi:SAM-dependent methyltransferase
VTRGFDVDTSGLVVPSTLAGSVDVLFDGQRVWSFSPRHDGSPAQAAQDDSLLVGWPKTLVPHLQGVADVRLVDHVSRDVLHEQDARFGESTQRVSVVDAEGHPLAVDKGGRLQRDFSNTDDSARDEIMDALVDVMRDLHDECGLDVYLMYGCLLGAVRDGHMIGHDSDADVAYLSRHHHPFDIIRECTAATRRMRSLGWKVVRMSGANFKVWVPTSGGRRVGIDVFGSFHIGEQFFVTGSLTGHLDESALLPFGTVTLEGREITAPARPEEVLEFTYGASWRVPDPAFHFGHDPVDVRRMDAWFRSSRRRIRFWGDFYNSPDARRVPTEPSRFAQWVQQRIADRGQSPDVVLDVGTGTGRDAAYFAAQGHRVIAYDYTSKGLRHTARLRKKARLKVAARTLNLEDLRAVLITGARLAHQDTARDVYARGLLDVLGPGARDNFWRFASMVQRRGGETFVEFRTPRSRGEKMFFGQHQRTFLAPDRAVREIEAHGGRVVHRETGRDLAPLGQENPHICRLVVRWNP